MLIPFKNIFSPVLTKSDAAASFLYLHGLCRQLENGACVWQLHTVSH